MGKEIHFVVGEVDWVCWQWFIIPVEFELAFRFNHCYSLKIFDAVLSIETFEMFATVHFEGFNYDWLTNFFSDGTIGGN